MEESKLCLFVVGGLHECFSRVLVVSWTLARAVGEEAIVLHEEVRTMPTYEPSGRTITQCASGCATLEENELILKPLYLIVRHIMSYH